MLGKGFFRLLGVPEDLHQGVAGVHLLDMAVELPGGLPLLDEVRLRALADLGGDDSRGRDGHQGDHGQERGNEEHHDEDADDRQQRRHDLAQGLLEGLGNIVDVVGDTAQYLAQRLAVEIAQRQAGQLGLHLLAQPEDRTLHGHGQQPPLHQATQRRRRGRSRAPAAGLGRRGRSRPPGRAPGSSKRAWRRACRAPRGATGPPFRLWCTPAGSFLAMTPEKIRLVASPSSRGPSTERPTLAAPSPMVKLISERSGRSSPSRRRAEGPKLRDFSTGPPPPMRPRPPKPPPPPGPRRTAMALTPPPPR